MDVQNRRAMSSDWHFNILSSGNTSSRSILTPSVTSILAETPQQRAFLEDYIQKDASYQAILNRQRHAHIQLAAEKKREIELYNIEKQQRYRFQGHYFGPGYKGPGNAPTFGPNQILYPVQKVKRFKSSEFRFGITRLPEHTLKEEKLVPIRIDLEAEGYRLSDTFTWNLNETVITPEMFADVLCDDLDLPPALFSADIAKAIQEQTQDYYLDVPSMMEAGESQQPEPQLSEPPSSAPELRMVIKLDITVGNRALIDQFEWDITNQNSSPEQFAGILAADLGLGGEFKTAIAHSIREQVHVHIKSLLLIGYEFDGSPVDDDELRQAFLPRVKRCIRDQELSIQFTPVLQHLTDIEVERMERDRMRETRRKRRQKRGRRGVNMPDRELQKSHRTGRATAPQPELSDDQFFGESNDQGTPGHSGTMSMRSNTLQRKSAQQARASIAADAALNNSTAYPSVRHNDHLSVALGMGNRVMLSGNRAFARPY